MTITDANGIEYLITEQEYWILTPGKFSWERDEGLIYPLRFAYLLHNAKIAKGILPPLAVLTSHFESRSLKFGNAKSAEDLIENIRLELYPERPSRLNSYFLNYDREVAEHRAKHWNWQNRELVKCHIIENTGIVHYANIKFYEQLAINPQDIELAQSYWEDFLPRDIQTQRFDLEIIADCGLFFPNWETFPELDVQSLRDYSEELEKLKSNNR